MPCDSSHCARDGREAESARVLMCLRELGQETGQFSEYYGRVETLDKDTSRLCAWCKANQGLVKYHSLELQMWWRDHQIADRKRESEEMAAARKAQVKARILSTLSDEEREALGLK